MLFDVKCVGIYWGYKNRRKWKSQVDKDNLPPDIAEKACK